MFTYIKHNDAIDIIFKNLNKLINIKYFNGKNVVMFGSSNIAGMIIEYLRNNGIIVNAIVDNDKRRQGCNVFGVSVYNPEQYLMPYNKKNVILIASYHQNDMIKQLTNWGYKLEKNIKLIIDLPQVLNDYSYVDRSGYVRLTDQEIKSRYLNILKYIDDICIKNRLRYFIGYGTLLGAVRHGGYIPWDDDIDIVMPIDDIKKLSSIMKDDNNYSLISCLDEKIEYYDTTFLISDNNVICDCNLFPQFTSGLTIDVFPFSGFPSDKGEQEKYITTIKNMEMIKWSKIYNEKECRKVNQEIIDYMLSYPYEKNELVSSILSPYFLKNIFSKNYFEDTIRIQFENITVNAPKEYDKYLCNIYGNYMELPPLEKRVGHHFFRAYKKQN